MAEDLTQVTRNVSTLLAEISDATNEYEARAGYNCRPGCGQCCLKPTVEAQVVEMLPMAQHLIDTGLADTVYDRASENADDACILYASTEGSPDMGRCGHYDHRPSLCRLFGFSAVNRKAGPPELAACHWHKKLAPEAVKSAQSAIDAGGSVPLFSDYTMKVRSLSPSSSWGFRLPINRALMIAIEKLMLARQYGSKSE